VSRGVSRRFSGRRWLEISWFSASVTEIFFKIFLKTISSEKFSHKKAEDDNSESVHKKLDKKSYGNRF
jgi:hypothetical protein